MSGIPILSRRREDPVPTRNPDEVKTMALIAAGAQAPDFELDSHLDEKVCLSDFKGARNVLLVSYPLDFTPT